MSDYSVSDFLDPDKFRTGYDTCDKCALRRYLDAREQCDDYSEIHIAINDAVVVRSRGADDSVRTYEKLGFHAYSSEFLRAILDSGCRVIVHRIIDSKLVKHVIAEGDRGRATRGGKRKRQSSKRNGRRLEVR